MVNIVAASWLDGWMAFLIKRKGIDFEAIH